LAPLPKQGRQIDAYPNQKSQAEDRTKGAGKHDYAAIMIVY
jgi:hypothetical protein